jgi:photosystem II stability/assembly factor-like uncharacterized protein
MSYSGIKYFLLIIIINVILIHITFAQSDWEIYLTEDFEDGIADGWGLGSGWNVELENENYILSGHDSTWQFAFTGENTWKNYSIKCDIKLLTGSMQINYRINEGNRYILGINEGSIDFKRNSPENEFIFESKAISVNYNVWHSVEIIGNEDNFRIFWDDELIMEHRDMEPFLFGRVALENSDGGHVQVDNVLIKGEFIPKTLSGYSWIKLNGPRGGTGYDIDIHPDNTNIIYVSDAAAGVHKSIDGGKTWQPKNKGIIARDGNTNDIIPIFCLTLDKKHDPDILWVGTQYQKGIYKSVDGGETWEQKDNGVPEFQRPEFRSFSIDPENPDIVYCGGNYSPDPTNFLKVRGFILKTTDGGDTWKQILNIGSLVRWIRINPLNTEIIYASTGIFDRDEFNFTGVIKSTDGGANWVSINTGIERLNAVSGLVMHPDNPEILYACTGKWPGGEGKTGGVYKTINGGANWISIYDGIENEPNVFTTLNLNPANPEIIYTTRDWAFAKSIDGGKTWQEVRDGPPNDSPGGVIDIEIHPENPQTIYVDAYGGGVFRSFDGGENWQDASKGYSGAQVYDIDFFNRHDPAKIITATHNGIYISDDGGESWLPFNDPRPGTPFSMAVNPDKENEVLIGDFTDYSIQKSNDGGQNWYHVFGPYPDGGNGLEDERMCNQIAYARSNSNIVFAGFSVGPHEIGLVDKVGPGIYKSTDGGETWSRKNNGLEDSYLNIMSIAIHPDNENIIYAGTLEDGIYKTIDGGNNWVRKSNGLTAVDIRAIAIDPYNTDTIYAGGGGGIGVLRSTNGGESWEEINEGINVICPSYLLPVGRTKTISNINEMPQSVFSGFYSYSVPWTKVTSIVIDPLNTNIIYAVDVASGVYRSQDYGKQWQPVIEGLTNKQIENLIISNTGKVLYAATSGGGVFRLTLKNFAPQILLTYPSTDSVISLYRGDSINFQANAFDLNGDTLTYSWLLNSTPIEGANTYNYLLNTDNLYTGSYDIRINIADNDTSVFHTWNLEIAEPTSIHNEQLGIQQSYALKNYPNPSSAVKINYNVPYLSKVKIEIYTLSGQYNCTLVNQVIEKGSYMTIWDGKDSHGNISQDGIYLCRLQIDNKKEQYIETTKIILIR